MANPGLTDSKTPAAPIGDPMVDDLTSGYKWVLGPDRTIDWSVSTGFQGEHFNNDADMRAQMQTALNVISSFINVHFNYVGAFNDPQAALDAGSEINLFPDANHLVFDDDEDTKDGGTYGAALYPESDNEGAAGDVAINMTGPSKNLTTFAPGSYGFQVLLHEVGHALGLKHPFDAETGHSTFQDDDKNGRDVDIWTMMSYGNLHYSAPDANHDATPMPLDILALQSLYGANTSTNAGDTNIVVSQTHDYRTIYDASGNDTVDASAAQQGWNITLPWTSYSTSVHVQTGYAQTLADDDADRPDSMIWLMGNIENVRGSSYNDIILGNTLNNVLMAGSGDDSVAGDAGNDYIRGEDGNDVVSGGSGFDDINGNRGNDTISGGEGGDWVVGGQDQDLLNGDNGDDIVYGNLGDDTCHGGNGDDWVRGGQGDDIIYGDAGNDFMSGDRGNDTIYGGAGADRFNLIAGAGVDRVMDFNSAEGDRVSIEGNLPYTLTFVDGNAVIDIGNGDQMVLVGVSNAAALGVWQWTG